MEAVILNASAKRPSGGSVLNRSRSHWWNTSDSYQPATPLIGHVDVDVCIVGGGINGVSTAYHLKKLDPSVDVALLEAEVVGFGASGRNAGQIIMKFGGTSPERLVGSHGADRGREAWDYVHRGIAFIEDVRDEEGIACDYTNTGTLNVCLRVEGDGRIDEAMRLMERMGQSQYVSYVEREQVEQELGSNQFGAAYHESRGGQFNPLKLVRGLKSAAERRGVWVYENSPVASIDTTGKLITLQTGLGVIRCKRLVLATNAFTHLLPSAKELGLAREQTPLMVKGVITEPLTPQQWEQLGWPRRSGVNIHSDLFYSFAPTADGRMLYVGGYYTSAPWDRNLAPEVDMRLKRAGPDHLAAFFPALSGVEVAQTWGGPISITPDWIPHVGEASDPRILYACGCWGNGMPCGAQNGRTLAELALGMRTENTDVWFVTRKKQKWPSRILAAFLANGVIRKRHVASRRIGGRMNPPLRFPR
ncbi:FAD-binding oxidoreductase [Mesorhizobium sp. B2-4-15]|uniref:NAD(P)/FAD-dependent oxidoreductase n=1 Tax=Mesorhizobium sp. B2-4-15 TaxID=2589934 RepID=UPI001152760C|nr:FAD-binding oxidoreductase [Mesorhizobium sp. B2-4-15]TPK60909.1 FAD-binding oxidoreductase [Mesorhizobium sp. B2-4-15]